VNGSYNDKKKMAWSLKFSINGKTNERMHSNEVGDLIGTSPSKIPRGGSPNPYLACQVLDDLAQRLLAGVMRESTWFKHKMQNGFKLIPKDPLLNHATRKDSQSEHS
jgi:hypothetical protein